MVCLHAYKNKPSDICTINEETYNTDRSINKIWINGFQGSNLRLAVSLALERTKKVEYVHVNVLSFPPHIFVLLSFPLKNSPKLEIVRYHK